MKTETKQEKIFRFKRELEQEKKKTIVNTIVLLMISLLLGFITSWIICSLMGANDWRVYALTLTMTLVMCVAYGIGLNWQLQNMNSNKKYASLSKEYEREKEFIRRLKETLPMIKSCRFDEIPAEMREFARCLLGEKMTPEEVIQNTEDLLETQECWLHVYDADNEKTVWSYLASWKWLKKVA